MAFPYPFCKRPELNIEVTDEAKEILIEHGFDSFLGARPLKRTIQKLIHSPFSLKVLRREFKAFMLNLPSV